MTSLKQLIFPTYVYILKRLENLASIALRIIWNSSVPAWFYHLTGIWPFNLSIAYVKQYVTLGWQRFVIAAAWRPEKDFERLSGCKHSLSFVPQNWENWVTFLCDALSGSPPKVGSIILKTELQPVSHFMWGFLVLWFSCCCLILLLSEGSWGLNLSRWHWNGGKGLFKLQGLKKKQLVWILLNLPIHILLIHQERALWSYLRFRIIWFGRFIVLSLFCAVLSGCGS